MNNAKVKYLVATSKTQLVVAASFQVCGSARSSWNFHLEAYSAGFTEDEHYLWGVAKYTSREPFETRNGFDDLSFRVYAERSLRRHLENQTQANWYLTFLSDSSPAPTLFYRQRFEDGGWQKISSYNFQLAEQLAMFQAQLVSKCLRTKDQNTRELISLMGDRLLELRRRTRSAAEETVRQLIL